MKVSGTVTYDDGSLIPGERLVVTFLPQMKALNATTYPRPGIAEVDVNTGKFECVTSHKYGDGVVPGEHKILVESIGSIERSLLASGAVPAEYRSAEKTPLRVDARFPVSFPDPQANGRAGAAQPPIKELQAKLAEIGGPAL